MIKSIKLQILTLLFIVPIFFYMGCEGEDDDDDDEVSSSTTTIQTQQPTSATTSTSQTSTAILDVDPDFLLTATEESAPVIGAATALRGMNLTAGSSAVYSGLYNMLRSWNPDTDNGVVDMGNIYHVLDVTGDQYEQVSISSGASSCEAGSCFDNCKPYFDEAWNNSCISEEGYVSSDLCDPLVADFDTHCGSTCESCYSGWAGFPDDDESCQLFDEAKVVNSPFDFGESTQYSCAVNNGSMGEAYPYGIAAGQSGSNGEVKNLLAGFVWAGSGTEGEFNVIQGSYNESTKALNLNFAQLVDHDSSQFGRRIEIIGNVDAHSFNLRSLAGPKDTSQIGTWVSIVGKGVSKGDGNYFLLKIKSNETGWSDGRYLCFEADINKTELDAMEVAKPTGDATVDQNCASYQAEVDAMTFFDFVTDQPHSLSNFNGNASSSILLDF